MNWIYFIEPLEATANISVNVPLTGYAFDNLLISLTVPNAASTEIKLTKTSRSSFLLGESEDAVYALDRNSDDQITLNLSLAELKQQITTFALSVKTSDDAKTSNIEFAITPDYHNRNAVFVVGSPRSGTTAVGNAIQRAYQVKSHGESHMAELLSNLVQQTKDYATATNQAKNKGTLTWEVPAIYLKAQLLENFRALYASYYPQQVIIDKTPGIPMITALPLLFQAFPNAKVVYCQRRALENIASRLRKFPNSTFEQHCRQWVVTIRRWKQAKQIINAFVPSNTPWNIEIEQLNLATRPEQELTRLAELLRLNVASTKRMIRYLEKSSPQQTGSSPDTSVDVASLGWSEEQVQFFYDTCSEEMALNGYSLDSAYFLEKS